MSSTNRNFVFAYAFLVILPLAGLVGILRGGHNLKAPVSIDGVWNLRIDSAQLASLPCGKILAASSKSIAISQSGRSFVLSLPGTPNLAGSGTLDATTLQAEIASQESSAESCPRGQQIALVANVDRRVNASTMQGSLSVANCPTCAHVNFQAGRQTPAAPQGGQ